MDSGASNAAPARGDTAGASTGHGAESAGIAVEDAALGGFGYRQQLDRAVGPVASFAIGFASISATTAVFTGFGGGYFTAGAPFVWTLLLAAAVFGIWTVIAADLTAKIPLAGYAYQWTSRIHGPGLAFFTGVSALIGWICAVTGVAFTMAGYLGGLFGWNLGETAQILIAVAVTALAALVNLYGVRVATLVNSIGVSLELVVTIGATLVVAVLAFSAPDRHQPFGVLIHGGTGGDGGSYLWVWLAASLGPFFGLIGVEACADVAEETKAARRVIPRTMFYALGASVVIELLMYIVYTLAIRNPDAVAAAESAPIEEILAQQLGPVVTRIVVAIALTNMFACLLACTLGGTRLAYSMARDNMLPASRVWRQVSARHRSPVNAVLGLLALSSLILFSALVSLQAFTYILGIASLSVMFGYLLQTIAAIIAARRGTIPAPEPGTFDLGRSRMPLYVVGVVAFAAVSAALVGLPQFVGNGPVFFGALAVAGVWWLAVLRPRLRSGAAGPSYARQNGT